MSPLVTERVSPTVVVTTHVFQAQGGGGHVSEGRGVSQNTLLLLQRRVKFIVSGRLFVSLSSPLIGFPASPTFDLDAA